MLPFPCTTCHAHAPPPTPFRRPSQEHAAPPAPIPPPPHLHRPSIIPFHITAPHPPRKLPTARFPHPSPHLVDAAQGRDIHGLAAHHTGGADTGGVLTGAAAKGERGRHGSTSAEGREHFGLCNTGTKLLATRM